MANTRTAIIVEGTKEAADFLKHKHEKVKQGAYSGVKDATMFVAGEVKLSIAGRRAEHTSVDTGRFLNSVDYAYADEEGVVFSDVEYSKFLEYGTSYTNPRRHFRNSLYRSQGSVNKILQKDVVDAVK